MSVPAAAGGVLSRAGILAFVFAGILRTAAWAETAVLQLTARTLEGNPLGDPVTRRVAVVSPDGIAPTELLPLLVYLPGWGGSADEVLQNTRGSLPAIAVQRLTAAGSPLRIAVVDGRSRYGGSQFLNSTATGNYADFVLRDVVPAVEQRYATRKNARFIGGHSSGGYGALMLAIKERAAFQGVVALSPDSDFEITHKALVEEPSVRAIKPAEVEAAMAAPDRFRLPKDGTAALVMGLCANYAPTADRPGRFEWLYDERGKWRQEVWERWLALDPLNALKREPHAFAASLPIYLDGAQFDEFGANIGAKKIHDVLKARSQTVSFYESPGHHSDRLAERLERGLRWVLSALREDQR